MSTLETLHAAVAAYPRSRRREAASTERWVRPALFALLALTAIAYMWNLGASGNANSFYAAAVQAATHSWKAFFFGSLDSSSFITVDKPPASLWVMALSGRVFGFSSWSMLVPQALEGVGAVWLLFAAVRRWFGAPAALAAGAMLAITPVAALMFRFNNPDALLVMALVASAYCMVRALEDARTRWLVATGALVGFAFLTKMGQALLVVPGFGLAYLICAPTSLRRRLTGLLAGLAALIVSAGWWIAIVALLPAGSRPLIDGSPGDNIFSLIFGYNGLSRLFGGGGGPGGGTGGANFSGSAGTLRLFNDLLGGQASWLLPAALVALVALAWQRRREPRTDRTRAALLVWGGWLLVTAAVFSYSQGVIHTYYAVALAPAIAALVAIGGQRLWAARASLAARVLAAAVVGLSGGWSFALLERTPAWHPWLRTLVLAATIAAVAGLLFAPLLGRRARAVGIAALAAAVVACFAGELAYTLQTVLTAHDGSIPSAGPTASTAALGGPGGGAAGGLAAPSGASTGTGFGPPPGASAGTGSRPPAGARSAAGTGGQLFGGTAAGAAAAGGRFGGGARSAGGAASVSRSLVSALEAGASRYRWVAATDGSTSAATYELATGGDPVMAIGGFNNNGGEITLAQFIRDVRAGEIHYYIASGSGAGGGPGGGGSSSETITSWVQSHYRATTIGGATVYDLSA